MQQQQQSSIVCVGNVSNSYMMGHTGEPQRCGELKRELPYWFVSLIVKKKETDAFSAVSQLSIKYSASELDPTRLKIWCFS